ncbi:P-loop NTPase fold protein [Dickeya zeae]|uniref:P-loop NTPase fold protein n=1 Tax=Dickeya zeae TaxID=204042 RepID=UPI000C9C63F3|nr:P-loop NTPase fold protein [Dickeya zeae]AUQ25122.1 hypothetical protein C1O30_08605 [Dickeya zeae]UJR58205.1 hypothetical protein HJ580_08505 [Dickeya zeae]UJR62217.1 hypothetical protein HJ586_08340 [Dickeya zeae]
MCINQHISENIDYYLSLDNPEYVFLITGDWGAGKTHFIENYITNYNEANKGNGKIIKISLFGLSSTSNIDEKIFQELHPFLSNKYTRLAGNFLKGALKFGLNVDLDGDKKADGSLNVGLEKINLNEIIPSNKNNSGVIIVFDDLERTDIPLKETLGYINYLVEISKVKIILIANEKKLNGNDEVLHTGKETKTYTDFKEKVIGKTFEIKHELDIILNEFLDETNSETLKKHKEIIQFVYKKSGTKNLRIIKKSILDFNYIINNLEKKHIEEKDFIESLIKVFFALSIEIKKGNINENDLRKVKSFMLKLEPTEQIDRIVHLYSFAGHGLYTGDLWADIFFNGDISRLKKATDCLVYFTNPQSKEKPIWLKLWYFRDLEMEEFISLSKQLIDDFKKLKECPVNILLHNLSLLIYFSKVKLIDFDISEIEKKSDEYITIYKNSNLWKTSSSPINPAFNGSGYEYFDSNDEDFIRLQGKITKVINDIRESEKEKNEKDQANSIEQNLLNYSQENLIEIILENYQFKPIFHLLSAREFFNTLLLSKNKAVNMLYQILYERYLSDNVKDDHHFWYGVKIENSFWNELNSQIVDNLYTSDLVKKNTLNKLRIKIIARIIEEINKHIN